MGIDKQPQQNYNEWRILYFILFLLLVGFFILNMFVGVVVENFHRCRIEQEREERAVRAIKKVKNEAKRRKSKALLLHENWSNDLIIFQKLKKLLTGLTTLPWDSTFITLSPPSILICWYQLSLVSMWSPCPWSSTWCQKYVFDTVGIFNI